jgi:hypothetical protein
MLSRLAYREVFPLELRAMARRGSNLFNRNDLRRAIRSAQEMGLSVDSVEVGRDGKIVVRTSKEGTASKPGNADVEQWLSKQHAHNR